jgi:hypothetical protein
LNAITQRHVSAPIPEVRLRIRKIVLTFFAQAEYFGHGFFDRLTKAAESIFRVPIALVFLLDPERNWFKSRYDVGDLKEADRQSSFVSV